ncbi:uncharacterized protein MELLADRAFT_95908 [Melampsora larici-populina 98AG31]|uniref:Ribosomal protein L33 n=1 Tax=Melampsora larici-populina (strain 98AG31 / pathotype 3-4-7) TaxID=747676 RepID=F4RDP9_MELLP|nr:uncharacterized protein MELLADRAFT_95908 [Melampsora larici-populina 98AG31]EGG09435.1 hypothetical protein MELLADRAFT_95908 [Melampsora larici-populina 98AG31]
MPPKTRTVLVKLVSTAGTGFFYTTTKVRTAERKIARMKYDPRDFLFANVSSSCPTSAKLEINLGRILSILESSKWNWKINLNY